jgi:Txe/YoeB family toxin of Txe-Axe toxin-antitoxin module
MNFVLLERIIEGITESRKVMNSRRINIQHRLIYQILIDIHTVKIIRMWTHYE